MSLRLCGASLIAALAALSLKGCSDDSNPAKEKAHTITLRNGVKMPILAAGTWQYNDSVAEQVVVDALNSGFSHIDTAYDYDNQVGVGKGLKRSGKPRHSIFVTTKVPGCGIQNSSGVSVDVCKTQTVDKIEMDLQQLNLSYLDMVLIHFPPCPGEDGTHKSPSESSCYAPKSGCTHPQACDLVRAQWGVLTDYYQQKKIKAIGVSNYCQACFHCLANVTEMPMVNQVQLHVGMGSNPQGFLSFAEANKVVLQAYSPFGSGGHGSSEILAGNLTTSIGAKYKKSAAQVALKWIASRNVGIATKSASKEHLKANADIFDFKLSDEDMASLDAATFAAEDTPSFLCNDPAPSAAAVQRVVV
ncbi:P100/11E [Symbiodinium natans]|uniref:P100/11E protein n=1 Tax=Symbiodinium natans TaxID=878477 RepID=A0A812TLL1_9DINO|nr:P100/11E [Symbiodinium natans]